MAPLMQPPRPATSGLVVFGRVLLVLGLLLLPGIAFFGYLSWHNFGAAESIITEHPDAGWVVEVIVQKAESQLMIAGVLTAAMLFLSGFGIGLSALGKRKSAQPVAAPFAQPVYGHAQPMAYPLGTTHVPTSQPPPAYWQG
jgi:hypothetical protein